MIQLAFSQNSYCFAQWSSQEISAISMQLNEMLSTLNCKILELLNKSLSYQYEVAFFQMEKFVCSFSFNWEKIERGGGFFKRVYLVQFN